MDLKSVERILLYIWYSLFSTSSNILNRYHNIVHSNELSGVQNSIQDTEGICTNHSTLVFLSIDNLCIQVSRKLLSNHLDKQNNSPLSIHQDNLCKLRTPKHISYKQLYSSRYYNSQDTDRTYLVYYWLSSFRHMFAHTSFRRADIILIYLDGRMSMISPMNWCT